MRGVSASCALRERPDGRLPTGSDYDGHNDYATPGAVPLCDPSSSPGEPSAISAASIRPARRRVLTTLDELAADAENLDLTPLVGRQPWRRLRIGDYRVLYRDTDPDRGEASGGYLVARVVHRRDLERAVGNL